VCDDRCLLKRARLFDGYSRLPNRLDASSRSISRHKRWRLPKATHRYILLNMFSLLRTILSLQSDEWTTEDSKKLLAGATPQELNLSNEEYEWHLAQLTAICLKGPDDRISDTWIRIVAKRYLDDPAWKRPHLRLPEKNEFHETLVQLVIGRKIFRDEDFPGRRVQLILNMIDWAAKEKVVSITVHNDMAADDYKKRMERSRLVPTESRPINADDNVCIRRRKGKIH
jgi:hypothetical protein